MALELELPPLNKVATSEAIPDSRVEQAALAQLVIPHVFSEAFLPAPKKSLADFLPNLDHFCEVCSYAFRIQGVLDDLCRKYGQDASGENFHTQYPVLVNKGDKGYLGGLFDGLKDCSPAVLAGLTGTWMEQGKLSPKFINSCKESADTI